MYASEQRKLESAIVPPLEKLEGKGPEGSQGVGSTSDGSSEGVLGCSQRTSYAAVRAELGIHSSITERYVRQLKWSLQKMGDK